MSNRTSVLNRALRWAAAPTQDVDSARPPKRFNLALQGGGAHGAFTWGVLDALLAEPDMIFDGISGTSAGAINAVLVADGLRRGGADEARAKLTAFWGDVSSQGPSPNFAAWEGTPVQVWLDAFANVWSPQELNPLNLNPLRDLIERHVDFDALRASQRPLFVAATNVQTGDLRVFARDEISAAAVMASASLPLLFPAVEIDGVPYWDGGYTGNPVLTPFLHASETEDVLLVQINPPARKKLPTTSRDIANRVSEISFNASLLAELRQIELINSLIDEGRLQRGIGPDHYRRLRLHRITLDDPEERLDPDSKLNTDRDFLERLRDDGRVAARQFLDTNRQDVGRHDTVALR